MKQPPALLPVLAIALNALLWGLSWLPMHALRDRGVHALWTTFLSYAVAVALVILWRPSTVRDLMRDKRLWLLMASSGLTNSSFNWAISIGDVVRVVLLLYLMPVWSVVLMWLVYGKKPHTLTVVRVLLAVVGVALVLQPPGSSWSTFTVPVPSSLADWLALFSGFVFACSSVLLNRLGQLPTIPKVLSMFSGCMLLSGLLALGLWLTDVGGVTPLPPLHMGQMGLVLLVSLQLIACNICLQYGAACMQTHTLTLLMSLEVLFAAVSSAWLGTGVLGNRVLVGGILVVGAALLEVFDHIGGLQRRRQPQEP